MTCSIALGATAYVLTSHHRSAAKNLNRCPPPHLVWTSHYPSSHIPSLCGIGVAHAGSSFPHWDVAEMLHINNKTNYKLTPCGPFFLLQVHMPAHTPLVIQCTQIHNTYIHQHLTLVSD